MPFGGLLTMGLIGGGLQLWGAHKQASAAKNAAKQQVASIDQAKAELRPIYEGNVARMQPYANIGTQALGGLGALMGYPAQPAAPMPASPPPTIGGMTPQQMDVIGRGVTQAVGALRSGGSAPMHTFGAQGSSYGGGNTFGPPQGRGVSFSPTIRLRAPDGEERDIPAQFAERMIAQGAQRV